MAHVTGAIRWVCPDCGRINSTRSDLYRQIGRCKGNDCHRTIVFGLRMLRTGRGHKHKVTKDWFGVVEVGQHRNGEPSNVLVDEVEDEVVTVPSPSPESTNPDD